MDEKIPLQDPLSMRIRDQKRVPQSTKQAPTFYRNLEEALNLRRENHNLFSITQNTWQVSNAVDFCSNDILSLGSSGLLRTEYLEELARYPNFTTGSGGARLIDGNSTYLENLEQEIADFHGAEAGLILSSGFEANVAVWTAIPRPGDAIVYDALVHASTHEGMKQSLAMDREEFEHNDLESFRNTLLSILESQPQIKLGKRSVLIAVESVYSMDGDVCPLQELVDIAREIFPDGNAQFVVDEAHSTGVIGPKGAGFVCELGLEKDIAVRLHTYGKAMSASGAVILGNKTIRAAIVNFARSFIFSTAPSFTFVAAIRAGYNLLKSGRTEQAQDRVQEIVRFFFDQITSHSTWEKAQDMKLLAIPFSEDWEEQPFVTHIVPIRSSKQRYNYWLFFHLSMAEFCVFMVEYPTVPKGQSRLKVTFHAKNTEAQIEGLVAAIYDWVEEMIDIEEGRSNDKVPSAARQVYAWMAEEGLTGFGMA